MYLVWQIVLLFILLILSAFFSGVEVALVSITNIQLHKMKQKDKKRANYVQRLKSNPQRMIITILIGNNLVNISATALATVMATNLFGSKGVGIAVGIMTFLVLVFGEIAPKSYASYHSEATALKVAKPLLILSKILKPLIIMFEWINNLTLKFFGTSYKKKSLITEEELKIAFELGEEEKVLEKDEKELLKNVLEFNDITAKEVMTERHNVFALDANMTVEKSIPIVARSSFSRIPLFLGSLDNIVGIIHTKDVLEAITDDEELFKLRDIGVKPFFVNEEILIDDLFKMFQERHTHMAIVVGKNGNMVGVVTVEDLLEELVGEIIDESDVNPHRIMRIEKNTILVDGETSPKYVNSFFNVNLPVDHETMNHLILTEYKGMPPRGHEVVVGNVSLFIEEVGEEHIERILVRKK